MNVARILSDKGGAVVTLPPHLTLSEAAQVLTEKKIGAVVVIAETGSLAGILSERDIVSAVSQRGAAALNETIANHMTRAVETATREELVASVMERMTHGRFRHLPVLEHGRLVGIVSIGDVVKHRLAQIESEATALRDYIAAG